MLLTLASLLFSGVAQAAISPPLGWIVLHPFSWMPALAVFSGLRGRRAFLAGWLTGISAELAIFCWLPGTVARFGGLPVPVAVLVWLLFAAGTGFYTAVFAWGVARLRTLAGARWPFAVAAWFCALEFLNPQLFGYLQGVAWYQQPWIFLVVATTGVSGMSFLVLLANGVLLQAFEARGQGASARRDCAANAAVLAMLLLAAVGLSRARLLAIERAEAASEPRTLALVQPNHTIPRREELLRGAPDAFAVDMLSLSREAAAAAGAGRRIDAFVWPEGALRSDPGQKRHAAVPAFVRETGSEVWTGANHYQAANGRVTATHNSAFRVHGDGELDVRYDKNVLVPFGEYVPLEGVVPGLDRIPTVGDFEAGEGVPRYTLGATRFVFLLCYEAIRSGFVREAVAGDVNLMVNLTIDAWYGDLSEQHQHLMLAATQSALHGVPLVRSTTTGISAFVDARGLLTATTGTFTREFLVGEVKPVRVPGLYARFGEWFAWLCVAASAAMLLLTRRRAGGSASPAATGPSTRAPAGATAPRRGRAGAARPRVRAGRPAP